MKFSFRQILASAVGAVLAALIASSFGVTGTIIGVAIGSMAATIGTALVSQSIEQGHEAVKQAVVRVPVGSSSTLLRRLGGTGAVGGSESSHDAVSTRRAAPTETVPAQTTSGAVDETTEMQSPAAPVDETHRLDITAVTGAPPTEHLEATAVAMPAVTGATGVGGAGVWVGRRQFTWKAIAGTVAIVFVFALLFVTAVELIAGKPLSSIFGPSGNGPSISRIFNNPSPPATSTTTTTSPPSTTSTTATSTTTTTTTSGTTTTSTTRPTVTTTTSTGATTTTSPAATSNTTTTVP